MTVRFLPPAEAELAEASDIIYVVAVVHAHRRPRTWQDRLREQEE